MSAHLPILSSAEMTPIPVSVDIDDRAQIAPLSRLQRGERERLPKRRDTTRIDARVGGTRVHVDLGRGPDGRVLEVWITLHKVGAPFRAVMDDLARAISLALQFGASPQKVASLHRHSRYEPSGIVDGHESITTATSISDFVAQVLELEAGGRP